jgi:carboxyl-terminal processing protease
MSPKPARSIHRSAGLFIGGIALLAAGFWLGNRYQPVIILPTEGGNRIPLISFVRSDGTAINDPLFNQVKGLMDDRYLRQNELDQKKMLYGAIQGMVGAAGDPYTAFFDPEQNEGVKGQLSGTYEGIGAQLGFKEKQLVVIAPLKDSPAAKAGVKAGDALLKIDDATTDGMSLDQAVSKIRGKAGTSIKLTLNRDSLDKPEILTITRQQITIDSIELSYKDNPDTSAVDEDIAYLKINRFGDTTIQEWDEAVATIRARGSKQLLLDVRDNPGGYLGAAIHIGSEFFTDGVIVGEENAKGQKEEFSVDHRGQLTTIPTVVLINKGSASASEIVAGALQGRNRAKLVGQNSFGKGSVQEVIELQDGTSLHVTIAKWLLPNGANIDKVGIKPDQVVELTDEDANANRDPQLDAAITLIAAQN